MYAVQDQVQPNAASLWCSTCGACAGAGYTKNYRGPWLHAALQSPIGTLMCLLTAEPRSTVELLIPCQNLCGTILVTPSMVWDRQGFKSKANAFLLA